MMSKTQSLLILMITLFFCAELNAQSFKKGDIIVNANYGAPNLKKAIIAWQDFNPERYGGGFFDSPQFLVSSTGIYSIKAEYAINDKFSVGFSSAYWSMDVTHIFESGEHRMASLFNVHNYKYKYHLSSLSTAVRGNYYFWKKKRMDAHLGVGLGITKHTSTYQYYPDVAGTEEFGRLNFKSGFGPHFSAAIGLRYYLLPFFGLNFEAGYDTGALFLGGIVFKLSTKKNETVR